MNTKDLSEQLQKQGFDLLAGGGLSLNNVNELQEKFGYNELPNPKEKGVIGLAAEVFSEPMVYLLIGCGVIYFFLGDYHEALMLLGFLFIIVGITIYQENKAEKAIHALAELSSPRAMVLREGKKQRISGRDLVCGDIVFLAEGDRVPADSFLLESEHLASDESLLTGESLPVEKNAFMNVLSGATIVRGHAVAIVTAIGTDSLLGKIGKSLLASTRAKTHLEVETNRIVKIFATGAIALCILVVIIYSLNRHDWLEGVLAGLTLAMAILPNELPAVLSIFLSLGAWRMSQRRVLTRKLPAIENLGAATVLCVDKTGTLTLNQMTIQYLATIESDFSLGTSHSDFVPEDFHEILEYGILASRKDLFDPMETAFFSAGNLYLTGTEHLHHDWHCQKEYPLSTELLSISQAWKSQSDGGYIIGAKGAPEAIVDLCHLESIISHKIMNKVQLIAQMGYRVIAVAKAKSSVALLPHHQHDFEFEFVGLLGILDPIRAEVPAAILECMQAGIQVIMMTGDHPTTAAHIAKKIGLPFSDKVITGEDMKRLSDIEITRELKHTSVFSRVMPEQKLKLVELLKKAGEVVAMTGDGVNDAPALKNADVGIAMGARGTDVARESASLVLLDDDFGSIVHAISAGRVVYKNLKGALTYLITVHIPIAAMSVIPVFFNLPLILLPAHIAFLHLIIEPTSSIAFEASELHSLVMREKPRAKDQSLFDRNMWLPSLIKGIGIMSVLLAIYLYTIQKNLNEGEIRACVFTALIASNIYLVISANGFSKLLKNKLSLSLGLGSLLLLLLVIFIPSVHSIFMFSSISLSKFVGCFLLGFVGILVASLFTEAITPR